MRINELFNGDNIYEYQETTTGHFYFEDEHNSEYFLDIEYQYSDNLIMLDDYLNAESEYISWKEISYGKRNDKGNNPFEPTKANNGSQFKILATVIHIITEFIRNDSTDDETCYYFTGDKNNGLSKLYSKIFKNIDTNGTSLIKKDFNFSQEILYCLIQKNLFKQMHESRIDELFKGSNVEVSDMNISQHGRSGFDFQIGGENYRVEDQGGDLVFYNGDNNNPNYEPTKNNQNQFDVLGTVYDCLLKFLSNNKKVYHFSGSNKNGLAKLYAIIFKRLAKDAKNLGYVSVDSGIYNYNEMTGKWWKRPMTNSHYWYFFPKEIFDEAGIRNSCEELKMPIFENRIDELFKGDSDVEIYNIDDNGYGFDINGKKYGVNLPNSEIVFYQKNNGTMVFTPTEHNSDQFLVLNTAIKCIQKLIQDSNKPIIFFTGDEDNGLSKVYSIIFNKLKNDVKKYNYIPISTKKYCWSNAKWRVSSLDNDYFYFIKEDTLEGKEMIEKAKEQNLPFVSQLNESLYGSKKSSYEKDGKCKLILRHSKTIDEDKRNSRTRNIDKIFLETSEGERIKCPVNNLKGARAWAKYVNKNGIIEDANTDRLFELVEDLQFMKETKKHLYKNRHSLSEEASNDILNLSEGIKSLNKLIASAARTGKIPEVEDIVFTTQISELYSMEDETLIEKAKRAKHRQMSLLAPVIQSEDIEMTETPFTKYAKKWLSDNEQQTDDNMVDNLSKGLKEIVDDEVDYTIDFDPNNTEAETVRKFAENLNCPVTSSYVLTIAGKMDDGEKLSKVQKQILRHIINGVDSDENLNEFAEPEREELPKKESPEIGDQVSTEYGPGSVVGKEGFTVEVELQNGSVISINEFNVDVTYRPGQGQIEEMSILESFFKQF